MKKWFKVFPEDGMCWEWGRGRTDAPGIVSIIYCTLMTRDGYILSRNAMNQKPKNLLFDQFKNLRFYRSNKKPACLSI